MVFSVNFVSAAWNWDNVKRVDGNIITIVNSLGLGEDIAKLELNTPYVYNVIRGNDRKVAEFTIENFGDYNNVFNNMEFYDLRNNNQKIDRQFVYKYKVLTGTKDVPYYYEVCVDDTKNLSNPTGIRCSQEIGGYNKEDVYEWSILNDKTILPKDNITIGIFTDVYANDYVEWIPTLYGVKINEWATWTDSLNVDLETYFPFENGSNVIEDNIKFITGAGTPVYNDSYCLIGKCLHANDGYVITNQTQQYFNFSRNISQTINFWVLTSLGDNFYLINTAGGIFMSMSSGKVYWEVGCGTAGVGTGTVKGTMNMLTFMRNNSGAFCFLNGVLDKSGYQTGAVAGPNLYLPHTATQSNRSFDEMSTWSRSLSAAEITQLYNGGAGITYIPTFFDIPTVSLDAPSNDTETLFLNYTFNASYSVAGGNNFTNATLYLWFTNGTLLNTNYSVVDNAINASNLSLNLQVADYYWNYYVCAVNTTTSKCGWGSEGNYSFSRKTFATNLATYNASTWETKTESFILNITSTSGTLTNGKLNYNGSNYSATITSYAAENYIINSTINIPLIIGNKSFYFTWDFDSSGQTSSSYSHYINATIFAFCNTTLSTRFVNYTFRDEGNSSSINGEIATSTFYFWLGSNQSINKSYTYSHTSGETNYTFCAIPKDKTLNLSLNIQYEADSYPQRIYSENLRYSNTTTEKTLYLLFSSDGIYVTFQVINVAEQPINGVTVTGNRTIGGVSTQVASGVTGADGGVTFWLDPDYLHAFIFSHPDYETYSTSIFPTQSSYSVTLSSTVTGTTDDYTQGISYTILPEDRWVNNDTTYSFNFTLSSTYWTVSEFGFTLYLDNGTILGTTSAATNGGTVNINQNTANLTKINMNYYWVIESNYTNGTAYWIVLDTSGTGYSIKNFFDNLSSRLRGGMFGADSFALSIIIFVLILVFTGVMSYKFGITSPAAISVIVFGLVLFFDVGLGLLDLPIGVDYLPTIIMAIVMVGAFVREVVK